MKRALFAMVITSVLLPASAARAGGFAEAVGGAAIPLGDDDYEAAVDTSFKLGVRAGSVGDRSGDGVRFGFELGVDWTPLSSDFDTSVTDESFHRIRGLVGGRAVLDLAGGKAAVVARFAVGVDIAYASISGTIFGAEFETSETNVGIALDPSIAVVGRVAGDSFVGLQLGFPIAFHDDDPEELDLDYTSYDLDLLFVVGTSL